MTVPSHLQTTQLQGNYIKQSLKTSCSTKRFSKQFLATSCHFKHPPAVKGQTHSPRRKVISAPFGTWRCQNEVSPEMTHPRTKVVPQSRQFSASSCTDCSACSSCTTKSPVLSFPGAVPATKSAHGGSQFFFSTSTDAVPRSSLKEGKNSQMVRKRTKTTQQQNNRKLQPTGRVSTIL